MNRRAPVGAWLGLALCALAIGRPAAADPAWVPRPVVRTLSNGLRVAVLHDPRAGFVQLQLRLPAGLEAEPPDQNGIANLTAQLIRQGTTSRDAARFNDELNRLGGSLQAQVAREYLTVGAAFLPGDLEEGLGLVSDAVLHPRFSELDLQRANVLAATRIVQQHLDPAVVAEEQAWTRALPTLPAARPMLGGVASLRKLTREQVFVFHRDHYLPEGAVLALAGDVTVDRAVQLAEQWFGGWTGRPAPAGPLPPPAGATRVWIVDRAGSRVDLVLGQPVSGYRAGDPAERAFAVQVLDYQIVSRRDALSRFGGRAALGLVRDGGLLELSAGGPADSAAAIATRLRDALSGARSRPPSAAAVATVARAAAGAYPAQFETLGGRLALWMLADQQGRPADEIATYVDRVGRFTPDQLRDALAHEVDPAAAVLIAVGPAAKLQRTLKAFGPIEVVRSLDLLDIASPAEAVRSASPEEAAAGRALVVQATAAHGGEARLRGIHDSIVEAHVQLTVQGELLNGTLRQMRKEPWRMVQSTVFNGGEVSQVLNGRKAWSSSPGDSMLRDADSASVAGLRSGFETDLPHLLLAAADTGARVAARGRDKIGTQDCDRVDVLLSDGQVRRLYFDVTTHRLAALEMPEPGFEFIGPSRRLYHDYRDVDGVAWPWAEERLIAGQNYMTLRFDAVRLNPGVADNEFVKPVNKRPRPRH